MADKTAQFVAVGAVPAEVPAGGVPGIDGSLARQIREAIATEDALTIVLANGLLSEEGRTNIFAELQVKTKLIRALYKKFVQVYGDTHTPRDFYEIRNLFR